MEDGKPVLGSLYVYAPNKGAPIFFTVVFAISAVGHIYQCHRYKAWKLIGLHSFCALCFTAGYALRDYGAFDHYYYSNNNLTIFILSQVLIYICPPLLELANYHVLGRIFYYVPYLAPLPANRVLSTFGALMALVEALNALGVAFSSNPSSSKSTQDLGSHLTIAALAIQLAVIVTFVLLAGLFHRRCNKSNIHTKVVKIPLITLYVSMILILIRCIYRLVEHVGNTTIAIDDLETLESLSPILRYEWYFYFFEATLMFINSAIWNLFHPGRYLPRNYHVYLAQDGREVEGEEKSDDRPFLAKAGSVLTFGLLWRKKRGSPPFHELNERPAASRQN
ncbi:uncharacterized protein K452DRAFT_280345 [Aplosporella prunicola CBS 121167]|uniref:RTA1 domain protein n=1 Tax=Aplosporella prunicola CBS 121167 TaxID=1176127 RepID=A0A6A6AYW3_9PEZI|nr:uncharacterized protein K452DRAFT_280345 [Aplosporella prunicola CBS 121167]KAF2136194.1 hypothetical protein K452DRAFT_280345 [Aplosporella prunicola CBS 121167]